MLPLLLHTKEIDIHICNGHTYYFFLMVFFPHRFLPSFRQLYPWQTYVFKATGRYPHLFLPHTCKYRYLVNLLVWQLVKMQLAHFLLKISFILIYIFFTSINIEEFQRIYYSSNLLKFSTESLFI